MFQKTGRLLQFLIITGVFLGSSVRIRAQNEQKTRKNEKKRGKMSRK
jgi:hypothetical protein